MVLILGYNGGGHSKVLQNTGLRIWMLELLYDKYCAPFDIPRVMLFYTCVWLKPLHLPKIGVFAAKRHVNHYLTLSLEFSNYPTFQHSYMWPAVLGYHDGICREVVVHLPL